MAPEEIKNKLKKSIPDIIKWMGELEPFKEDAVDCIPEPPLIDKELYEKYVIPNFIPCGCSFGKFQGQGKDYCH